MANLLFKSRLLIPPHVIGSEILLFVVFRAIDETVMWITNGNTIKSSKKFMIGSVLCQAILGDKIDFKKPLNPTIDMNERGTHAREWVSP